MWSTNRFQSQGHEWGYGDYTSNRWAWQLANVAALEEPLHCRGSLGLWEVPSDLLEQGTLRIPAGYCATLNSGPAYSEFGPKT